jgi:hypothetical protein
VPSCRPTSLGFVAEFWPWVGSYVNYRSLLFCLMARSTTELVGVLVSLHVHSGHSRRSGVHDCGSGFGEPCAFVLSEASSALFCRWVAVVELRHCRNNRFAAPRCRRCSTSFVGLVIQPTPPTCPCPLLRLKPCRC